MHSRSSRIPCQPPHYFLHRISHKPPAAAAPLHHRHRQRHLRPATRAGSQSSTIRGRSIQHLHPLAYVAHADPRPRPRDLAHRRPPRSSMPTPSSSTSTSSLPVRREPGSCSVTVPPSIRGSSPCLIEFSSSGCSSMLGTTIVQRFRVLSPSPPAASRQTAPARCPGSRR